MTRVLVVDDEPQLLRTLALNLRACDHDVITASTAAESIDHMPGLPPDMVILDVDPDADGHSTRDRDRSHLGEASGWAQAARMQEHPVGPSSSSAGGLRATTKAVCSQ